MAIWGYVGKRLLFAAFVVWLVVSLSFAFLVLTPDPQVGVVAYYEGAEAVEEYREEHNLDDPFLVRYARWTHNIVTLDWGTSEVAGGIGSSASVTQVLADRLPVTLAYVVPAMAFALVGGVGLGVYSTLNPGSLADRLLSGGVYLGYGVPNYWIAVVALLVVPAGLVELLGGSRTFTTLVLPAAVLGTSLLAGQVRYARAESREYVNTDFLKLVRAKGAADRHVAAHLLRNAALPIFSLFFSDLLGVLVVNVFVLETVIGIPGIGRIGLRAVQARDLSLVIGISIVFAVVGVLANLLQDLAYFALDPRIDVD